MSSPKPIKIIYDARRSKLTLFDDNTVKKACYPKSFPRDYVRRYFFLSQAHREYRGAKALNKIGLLTPKPISAEISFSPFSKTESYYRMSFLEDHTLTFWLASTEKEIMVVKMVAEELNKMISHKLCIKDFGLHNAMLSTDNKLVWIDTDVKRFYSKSAAKKYKIKKIRSFNNRHKELISKDALDLFNHITKND